MGKFIERQNVTHYVDLLKIEVDPAKRATIQKLLAEARAGAPPTMPELKGHQI